jgi:hypothetical protein
MLQEAADVGVVLAHAEAPSLSSTARDYAPVAGD